MSIPTLILKSLLYHSAHLLISKTVCLVLKSSLVYCLGFASYLRGLCWMLHLALNRCRMADSPTFTTNVGIKALAFVTTKMLGEFAIYFGQRFVKRQLPIFKLASWYCLRHYPSSIDSEECSPFRSWSNGHPTPDLAQTGWLNFLRLGKVRMIAFLGRHLTYLAIRNSFLLLEFWECLKLAR